VPVTFSLISCTLGTDYKSNKSYVYSLLTSSCMFFLGFLLTHNSQESVKLKKGKVLERFWDHKECKYSLHSNIYIQLNLKLDSWTSM